MEKKARTEDLFEIVKQVNGKFALVSKHTGRPLVYYHGPKGERPSKEWVSKQERRIHAFKNMKEMENRTEKLLETIRELKKRI